MREGKRSQERPMALSSLFAARASVQRIPSCAMGIGVLDSRTLRRSIIRDRRKGKRRDSFVQ